MHKPSGGPLAHYQADLRQSDFQHDPAQERVVHELQEVYMALVQAESCHNKSNIFGRIRALFDSGNDVPVRGLYLWGGVGRGKTYLMDAFYESLPFERKMRAHFHRFMRHVHAELKALDGTKNPLESVAERLAARARVICFDEFFVADIADAMILGSLFELLFARRVTLVATSNIVPDELYKDGLQRQRFLPAISLINQHTRVIHLDAACDYRLRLLE
ncbi:MAG: cell division protein ZapE, partial [Pseudomonadales bacterium]